MTSYTKKQQQAIDMFNYYKKYAISEYEKIFKDLTTPSMYEIQNRIQDKYEINDDIMEIINKYYMKNKNKVNIKFFNKNGFKYKQRYGLCLTYPGTEKIRVDDLHRPQVILKDSFINISPDYPYNEVDKDTKKQKYYGNYKNHYIYLEGYSKSNGIIQPIYKCEMLNINGWYFDFASYHYYTRGKAVSYKYCISQLSKDELKILLDNAGIKYNKSDSKHALVCRLIGENPKDNKYTPDMKNMRR